MNRNGFEDRRRAADCYQRWFRRVESPKLTPGHPQHPKRAAHRGHDGVPARRPGPGAQADPGGARARCRRGLRSERSLRSGSETGIKGSCHLAALRGRGSK